jgi:hypothetical protein
MLHGSSLLPVCERTNDARLSTRRRRGATRRRVVDVLVELVTRTAAAAPVMDVAKELQGPLGQFA